MNTSDSAFQPGANTVPKPFRVRFVPRSAESAEVVRQEWARAREEGYELGGALVGLDGVAVE